MGDKFNVVDEFAPEGAFLSAHYKKGFAYTTINVRLPVILDHILDGLSRARDQLVSEKGEKCTDDLNDIAGGIAKLKAEMQADEPMYLLDDGGSDQKIWNDFLENLPADKRSFYSGLWLHVECYLYRRLKSIFRQSSVLKPFDYFGKQKRDSFLGSVQAFVTLATRMTELRDLKTAEEIKGGFVKLLKVNLWGNRFDLSISVGENMSQSADPFAMLAELDQCILADQSDDVWNALQATATTSTTIDLIHDNAGYEFFTDLVLIDYVLSHNIAEKVRSHVKAIPWFISDVMPEDFEWTLGQLNSSDNGDLRGFGKRLSDYLQSGKLVCIPNDFWTSPYDFAGMEQANGDLYKVLQGSKCLIFKGDLNYRKLMGDINWDPTTPFTKALRNFCPSNVCALRTIKADTVSGLKPGAMEELNKKSSKWMETGEYGLIQLAERK